MRNRTYGSVAGLLVIVAVLLAANLILSAPGQARAGNGPPVKAVELRLFEGGGPGGPAVTAYRLWSDGTVERNQGLTDPLTNPEECFTFDWCGWQVVPE